MTETNFKVYELTGYETDEELIEMGAYTQEQIDKLVSDFKAKLKKVSESHQVTYNASEGTYTLDGGNWIYTYSRLGGTPISAVNKKAFSRLRISRDE